MSGAKYKYYLSNHATVSYVWKCQVVKDGFIDCGEFEVRIRGKERIAEAVRICAALNAAEKLRTSPLNCTGCRHSINRFDDKLPYHCECVSCCRYSGSRVDYYKAMDGMISKHRRN